MYQTEKENREHVITFNLPIDLDKFFRIYFKERTNRQFFLSLSVTLNIKGKKENLETIKTNVTVF